MKSWGSIYLTLNQSNLTLDQKVGALEFSEQWFLTVERHLKTLVLLGIGQTDTFEERKWHELLICTWTPARKKKNQTTKPLQSRVKIHAMCISQERRSACPPCKRQIWHSAPRKSQHGGPDLPSSSQMPFLGKGNSQLIKPKSLQTIWRLIAREERKGIQACSLKHLFPLFESNHLSSMLGILEVYSIAAWTM